MILDMISGYETFGFGGSDTTRGLGLVEALKEKGKTVYDHWLADLSAEVSLAIRKSQMTPTVSCAAPTRFPPPARS